MEEKRKRRHKKRKAAKRRKNAMLTKEELRAKRRRERRRFVIMERIAVAFFVLGAIGGGFAIVWNLPTMKLNRQLNAGDEYTEEEAYQEAIEAYENALEIDSASVKAYRCMAGAYLDMEDGSHAKQVLYSGWENTQDESLLQYYCTVILNEAVDEINEERADGETIDKIILALDQGIMDEESLKLLDVAYGRMLGQYQEAAPAIDFVSYGQAVEKLLDLYQRSPSDQIAAMASRFGYLDVKELILPEGQVDTYLDILLRTNEIVPDAGRDSLIACLQKEKEIQEIFAGIFQEFDNGNFEAAKEFIISDTYTGLRDAFIEGTMEYWTGETQIPVSREYVKLRQDDGAWTFSFPEFGENEATAGVITVWGTDMKDNGVLRTCISYEPAMENGVYFPHTQYVISYMYSNLQKKNAFVYEMNYHFETRTWTEEGMTTHMVGDWGGSYQWEKRY